MQAPGFDLDSKAGGYVDVIAATNGCATPVAARVLHAFINAYTTVARKVWFVESVATFVE